MAETKRFSAEGLTRLAREILEAAQTPNDVAQRVAEILVNANLAGHDSHGVLRIPTYLEQIDKGILAPAVRPKTVQQSPSTALLDAQQGWGHYTAWEAMKLAIDKARETGIGAVAIGQCNHIGRLGEYCEQAADEGFASMVTIGMAGPGIGGAAPFGGTGRMMGTNPWAFGIPTANEPPVVVDFATTIIAEGKVQVARSKSAPLPAGSMLDKDGNPSTSTDDYYAGGTLMHAGGHKGYALGLVACLLGGLATGMDPWLKHFKLSDPAWCMGGVFLLALDVERFRPLDDYKSAASAVVAGLKSSKPAPGFTEVLTPGEPEYRNRRQRLAEGIDVPESIVKQLRDACENLGVSLEHFA